jgi:branched-chain amino acid transport system ATP-binding protein
VLASSSSVRSEAKPASMLRVKALSVRYGRITAVSGLDLEIASGQCTGLIGANGAGKTSVLRGISGLSDAPSGQIWLDERRIDKLPAGRRARHGLGHVLENRHVFANMTVTDNLRLGYSNLTAPNSGFPDRLEQTLAVFRELKPMLASLAGSLSGGQQQLLAIARALISGPKVLMLDEPSTGLAPALIGRVAEVIESVLAAGTAVLLVEQSLELVRRSAGDVHLLSHGTIVATSQGSDPELPSLAHSVYLDAPVSAINERDDHVD